MTCAHPLAIPTTCAVRDPTPATLMASSTAFRAFATPRVAPMTSVGRGGRARRAVHARAQAPKRADADAASAPLPRRTAVLKTLVALTAVALPRAARAEPVLQAQDSGALDAAQTPPERRPTKRVLITGPNSGIGFDAACKLCALGFDVVLACRTEAKAVDAAGRIEAAVGERGITVRPGQLIPVECNLADFASIRKFAASSEGEKPVDVLVLNAGVQYSGDDVIRRTSDGLEITVGTNHLGHFLLTNLMLPRLASAVGTGPDDVGTCSLSQIRRHAALPKLVTVVHTSRYTER